MLDESDIQKLLRLKRYEQPSPEYFQKFLHDFHRRQRADLLRQPVWKIALERMQAFLSEHSMGRYAYATATAAVLLFAGVASFNILNSNPAPALAYHSEAGSHIRLAKTSDDILPNIPVSDAQSSAEHPRYVIDTRPASYERPFSF